MKKIEITQDNFYLGTKCKFKGCKRPKRFADFTSRGQYEEISSEYWYGENEKGKYVIRCSNHWSGSNNTRKVYCCGKIASCYWWLITNSNKNSSHCGKAYFTDFNLN